MTDKGISTATGIRVLPDTFAGLAKGAGMDLRTVYNLAAADNLVMAVRRYTQRSEEQRGTRLTGTQAQRQLAQRARPVPGGPEGVRRLLQLHTVRRNAWWL